MPVRGGTAQLSEKGILGLFFQAWEGAHNLSWVELISMMVNSNEKTEEYRFLGESPNLEEEIDGLKLKELLAHGFEITNKKFSTGLRLPTVDLRRDKSGQILQRLSEMSQKSVTHWARLLTFLLQNGHLADCYDGKKFYAVDHEEGESGAQSNLLTKTDIPELKVVDPARPTQVEFVDAVLGVIEHFFTYVDDQGEPINEDATSFLAMVPVRMWGKAAAGVASEHLSTTVTNPLTKLPLQVTVAPNARLKSTPNNLHVFRTDGSGSAKPFIRQEEDEVRPNVLGAGSDHEFNNDEWLFKLSTWRNVGYGNWKMAINAELST